MSTADARDPLRQLLSLTQTLTSSLDLQEVLDSVARAAVDLLPGSVARISVLEDDRLVFAAEAGIREAAGGRRAEYRSDFKLGEGLLGHVAVNRAPLVVPDMLSDPRTINREWGVQQGYVGYVGVPLLVRDRLVGVVSLVSRAPHEFTRDEMEILTAFSAQAAIAIENARLFAETSGRLRASETLLDVARIFVLNLPPEEALRRAARTVGRALGADMVGAYAYDAAHDALVPIAGYHVPEELREWFTTTPIVVAKAGALGDALRAGTPFATPDAHREGPPDFSPRLPPHSLLFAPTPVRGESVGGIFLVWWTPGRVFSSAEMSLLTGVASQLGLALENAELIRQTQDKLRETEALLDFSRALSSTLDLRALMRPLVEHVRVLFEPDSVGVWLADEVTGALTPFAGRGVPADLAPRLKGYRLDLDASPFYREGVTERRVMVSTNVADDPRISPSARTIVPRRTELFVPIVAKGRTIAALFAVWFHRTRTFAPAELALAEAAGNQAGVAIENAYLFGENRRKLEETAVLYDLSRSLTGQLQIGEIVRALRQEVMRVLDTTNMDLFVYDPGRREVEAIEPVREGDRRRRPLGRGLVSRVIQRRAALRTADYLASCREEGVDPQPGVLGLPHWLGVPLIAGDEVIGAIVLRSAIRPFTGADERLLANVAGLAALSMRSARLFLDLAGQRRRLTTLVDVARRLTRGLDLATVLTSIAGAAALVFEGEAGCRLLEGDELVRIGVTPGARDVMVRERIRVGESLSGRAVVSGQPVITSDSAADPRLIPEHRAAIDADRTGALMCLPISVGPRVVGTLHIFRERGYRFDEEAQRIAMSLADQAGIAIENARLYEAQRHRTARLATLARLNQLVSSSLDTGAVLAGIARAAAELMQAPVVLFWVADEGRRALELTTWSDPKFSEDFPLRAVSYGQGGAGWVAENRRPLDIPNVFADGRVLAHDWWRAHGLSAHYSTPVMFEDSLLAVLALAGTAPFKFGPDDMDLLGSFVAQAAVALRNARLYGELKAAHERVQQAQEQLVAAEKLRALGEMAAGVAHDFNNLLAVIYGRAELMMRWTREPKLQESLDAIFRAAMDGAETVRRILEFARTQQARSFQRVDLAALCREVVGLIEPRWKDAAQAAGITYDVAVEGGPVPPVTGRPEELREVLLNLATNALEAMPEGGGLRFTLGTGPGDVTLTVQDTGGGIPEDVRARVFEPFFTTKGPRGTGLGLALAWGIVTRHGGTIGVDSVPGTGTTFTIRLPVATGDEPVIEEAVAPSPIVPPLRDVPRRAARILVIEDEPMVRSVLREIFLGSGHQVLEAADGATGLAVLGSEPADLVVTDVSMPGLSGWDVALACHARFPNVPVGFITGWGGQIDATQLARHHVAFVITKPFHGDNVLRMVSAVLWGTAA
ncbi:MAG: GAF domain-containing protein [Candidatus Rokubacteria bacterium]|nr:GAF domain-containing protein [Candidatus Rokubacteria bacterium]